MLYEGKAVLSEQEVDLLLSRLGDKPMNEEEDYVDTLINGCWGTAGKGPATELPSEEPLPSTHKSALGRCPRCGQPYGYEFLDSTGDPVNVFSDCLCGQ